jgi:hypothetical protein
MFGKRKSHFCPYNVSIGAFDDGFAPSDSLKWQQSYEVVWPFREGGAPDRRQCSGAIISIFADLRRMLRLILNSKSDQGTTSHSRRRALSKDE